jgi:hypothetical protein
MTEDATRFADPRIPAETSTPQTHLFNLSEVPLTRIRLRLAAAWTQLRG